MLPGGLDALSERWWALDPRGRAVLFGIALACLVALAGARGLSAPYGEEREVLVATEDLPAGAVLEPGEGLRTARWPADLVPDGATLDATGVLRGALPAGSVLTDAHRVTGGVGALAGEGRVAVPLPADALPPLAAGDRVQVVTADADGVGRTVTDAAEVLATDDTAVWLAVAPDAAGEVAAAGLRGTLTVAVLPP